ncbi:MAG: capsular biosynthesis protein [Pseudomonadota bacterium]|nr:capsular biosynthesis protein [Pseudomonadota bacterium]
MGLIEKAGGAFGDIPDAANELAPAPETGGEPAPFDINFEALAASGFYTPAGRANRLSLELRAIKRRLLRRLGLRNSAGERRMTRRGGRNRNLVLVTSSRPGEGKTFCAINLALSLACEEQLEVLLVDADAPRPKVRATFGLPQGPGLSDRLRDPAIPALSVCRRARQAPLTIMSEGGPVDRAGELYGSAQAQRLFTELSARRPGGLVIIDAPPALATEEAIILARHVDEVIFIIEADATPEVAAGAALDEMLEANPNVSLVLNRCLVSGGAAYYGSYDDYDRVRDSGTTQPIRQDEGKQE